MIRYSPNMCYTGQHLNTSWVKSQTEQKHSRGYSVHSWCLNDTIWWDGVWGDFRWVTARGIHYFHGCYRGKILLLETTSRRKTTTQCKIYSRMVTTLSRVARMVDPHPIFERNGDMASLQNPSIHNIILYISNNQTCYNPLSLTAIQKLLEMIGRVRLYPRLLVATVLDSYINQTARSGDHPSM